MLKTTFYRAVFTVLCAASVTPTLRASIISNFNSSSEGWTSSHNVCSFNPNAGNPPGDLDCGVQITGPTLTAPAKFLGNDSAASGNTFSFDIFNHLSNVGLTIDLFGNGEGIMYQIGSVAPSFSWTHETVPLTAGSWTALNSIAKPSAAGFQAILGDLTGIQVVTSIPTFSDLAFDNFDLAGPTPVPEPSAFLPLSLALALLAIGAKRRRCSLAKFESGPPANYAVVKLQPTKCYAVAHENGVHS